MIIRMIRELRHPRARRIPISRVRSNTDMIIVFVTPTAPIRTARSEIARLAASIASTPWSTLPYSSTEDTVVSVSDPDSIASATARGSLPGLTLTYRAVTSPSLCVSCCTMPSGAYAPPSKSGISPR